MRMWAWLRSEGEKCGGWHVWYCKGLNGEGGRAGLNDGSAWGEEGVAEESRM
jgi:hypothetical protein